MAATATTVDAVPASPPAASALPAGQRDATRREWAGFMAMVLGMFMAILDIQIVASSLTDIQAGLAASADEISWVQTSYLIAEVVMIPLSGFLSRLLSTRTMFVISSTGFTLASIACAMSWSLESMIVFRALQGFIGGAMIPTVFATAFTLFPDRQRTLVTVMIGLVATMAPTLGPTLGGWLTQTMSWHWLFLANVLPGAVVILIVAWLVDFDRPDWSLLRGFDGIGLALMALFLGSLEYVVEEGPRNDWLEDRTIAMFAAVAAVAAIGFFYRMFTYERPIVWLKAFHDRNFAVGSLYSFIIGIGLYGSVYLLPLFLARVRGWNSLDIGLLMIVTGAAQFLSAPVAGALSKRLELRVMLGMGLLLFGGGMWLQSFATAEWGFWEYFLPQAVRGFSLMFCFLPINTLALGTLPPQELKNASGLYNLMRNLGGAIGLAAINTVMIQQDAIHTARLAEHLTAANPGVTNYLSSLAAYYTGLGVADPRAAALQTLTRLADREALVMTFNDTLLLLAGLFFSALLLMPLIRKPRAAAEGGH
ncbi:MAG TPA: DHA2 family efflux MFS transporter permease subunit [Verrucomicrobiae bacterium]|nr:DHA2 family efflux MFS transporter permease subunit [Verrucomicrobiae bacterium]